MVSPFPPIPLPSSTYTVKLLKRPAGKKRLGSNGVSHLNKETLFFK